MLIPDNPSETLCGVFTRKQESDIKIEKGKPFKRFGEERQEADLGVLPQWSAVLRHTQAILERWNIQKEGKSCSDSHEIGCSNLVEFLNRCELVSGVQE